MIDLFHFVLWMIACFVCLFVVCFFVKLVKLDLCHVVYTGFHWRYANMLTRKKRKGRLLIFSSNKFNLLIKISELTVWPWIRALYNKMIALPRGLLPWAGCFHHLLFHLHKSKFLQILTSNFQYLGSATLKLSSKFSIY